MKAWLLRWLRFSATLVFVVLPVVTLLVTLAASPAVLAADSQTSFKTVVYIPVGVTVKMKDRQWLESSWATISSQVHVDKVYIETYRSRVLADDQNVEDVKKFFHDHGVEVAGGICFSDADHGQFVSFVYTKPEDRDYVKRVSEFTAKHFDEVILDDFFFANTKTASDIAAKGEQSWTDFRLKTMDDVSRDLVEGAARAVNPKIKMIIKFPNWYEHLQGNGYDLGEEPRIFDGIYAGTETRDPVETDQSLQQYEGYAIARYFENIAPGRMGGGWVDTYSIRYVDRYSEQLWLTVFAKAKEMTLFNYMDLLREAKAGERPWQTAPTNVDWERIVKRGQGKPTFASVAGDALDQVKPLIGRLGKPIGIASYRPAHAVGEDFLHNFLGMIGIPIELYPEFPKDAPIILLTEAAKFDPNIVGEMKAQLEAGKTVVITSGLLRALEHEGEGNGGVSSRANSIDDIVELRTTGMQEPVTSFLGAYGPGSGSGFGAAANPILFPQIRFLTNDAWPVVRGIADNNAFPILLMDRYGKGKLLVLAIPDNFTDLYEIPEPALNAIRGYIMGDFPVRVEAPSKVSIFAYDNGSFIVESFRDQPAEVTIVVPAGTTVTNLVSGERPAEVPRAKAPEWQRAYTPPTSAYRVEVQPHSYLAFFTNK
ncbi:MAG: hypothetical protein ACLPLR_03880 [Terriglobales bacterium]